MKLSECGLRKPVLLVLSLLMFGVAGWGQTLPQTKFYFPQIAVGHGAGMKYVTIVVLTNPSAQTATGSFSLLNDSGTALPDVRISNFVTGESAMAATQSFTVAPMSLSIWMAESEGTISGGWAHISTETADGGNGVAIGGTALYQLALEPTDAVFSMAGVGAVSLRNQVLIPFFDGDAGGNRTGIAVGSVQPNTLTFTYRNEAGTALYTAERILPANGHTAFFLDALFPALAALGQDEYALGTIQITGTAPLGAVGILFEGLIMTTAPVIPVN
jgi:hypothetical protein